VIKIMLADDEESMQTLVERIVDASNYTFCSATNDLMALEVFAKGLCQREP
jgi:CheY-like chemotaxis protein